MARPNKSMPASGIGKKGGYSGSKPGSSMGPPIKVPASPAAGASAAGKKKK